MAQVVLLSATPPDARNEETLMSLRALEKRAAHDKFRVHSVTDDAAAADVILFAETYGAGWRFERVRGHSFTRSYRDKCFVFSSSAYVIPFLPGIYTGVSRRWASRRTISGFYLGGSDNPFTTFTPPSDGLRYLFSFIGSTSTAAVRRDIVRLKHPRGLVQDTSADFTRILNQRMTARESSDYYRRYADATKESKFILCPRGVSVSSIRLFETMQMGRVPVILSDDWVKPPGPSWEAFSIRVRERDYAQIPRILEEREHEATRMGELARAQWEEWYSEETAFHRVVEWCLAIKRQRRLPESIARWPAYLQLFERFHFRRMMGEKLRRLGRGVAQPTDDEPPTAKQPLGGQPSKG